MLKILKLKLRIIVREFTNNNNFFTDSLVIVKILNLTFIKAQVLKKFSNFKLESFQNYKLFI